MEGIMSYFRINSEYLPAVLFLIFISWIFFGTNEIDAIFLKFGTTYNDFNGFFCAGWAGICN